MSVVLLSMTFTCYCCYCCCRGVILDHLRSLHQCILLVCRLCQPSSHPVPALVLVLVPVLNLNHLSATTLLPLSLPTLYLPSQLIVVVAVVVVFCCSLWYSRQKTRKGEWNNADDVNRNDGGILLMSMVVVMVVMVMMVMMAPILHPPLSPPQ